MIQKRDGNVINLKHNGKAAVWVGGIESQKTLCVRAEIRICSDANVHHTNTYAPI